ncbi:MAG: type IV toxin-antitoxin system AbiEi family antitoxin [bacterium]
MILYSCVSVNRYISVNNERDERKMKMVSEKQILNKVPVLIEKNIPAFKIRKIVHQPKIKGIIPDMVIDVDIAGKKRKLIIEVKSRGFPSQILQSIPILLKAASVIKNSYPIFVSDFISKNGASICKENNIGYLDLAGNCYVGLKEVYIEKVGEEQIKRTHSILKKLFSPKATRIIRALLEDPERLWGISELSQTLEVALGYTHEVIAKLLKQGYVIRDQKKQIHLSRPAELLNDWARQYRISPESIHSYYSSIKNPQELMKKIANTLKRNRTTYCFTLHAGASLVAPFMRFNDVHFYYLEDIKRIVQQLELEEIEFGGTVHLIEPYEQGIFYQKQTIEGKDVVCNTQLYLDLNQYPTRGKEQAEFLREKRIKY